MIKVLGLALYGPLAASNRYRLGQYIPGLARSDIELQINYLLGDNYLRYRFYGGAPPVKSMFRSGLARLAELRRTTNYDAAILHCELFPLMPGWLERSLIRKPYIYDFDDAFYLKYRSGKLGIARPLLGGKFDAVIAGAAAVTAGNRVLSQYANQHNANTHFLPTVVDTERYLPAQPRRSDTFTVGWIGTPSTAPYLSEIVRPLAIIGQEGPVRLVVIGGKAPTVPNVEVIEIEWREQDEVDRINSLDVGLMPMPEDDWARGKCAFKLIQYMACGVPVIASRVGANVDVVNAECGLLAATPQEWVSSLRVMRDEFHKRCQMGQAGRERVIQHYSLRSTLPVLADLIHKVVAQV